MSPWRRGSGKCETVSRRSAAHRADALPISMQLVIAADYLGSCYIEQLVDGVGAH